MPLSNDVSPIPPHLELAAASPPPLRESFFSFRNYSLGQKQLLNYLEHSLLLGDFSEWRYARTVNIGQAVFRFEITTSNLPGSGACGLRVECVQRGSSLSNADVIGGKEPLHLPPTEYVISSVHERAGQTSYTVPILIEHAGRAASALFNQLLIRQEAYNRFHRTLIERRRAPCDIFRRRSVHFDYHRVEWSLPRSLVEVVRVLPAKLDSSEQRFFLRWTQYGDKRKVGTPAFVIQFRDSRIADIFRSYGYLQG